MKGEIKLQNPISKNGKMYDVLRYDTDKIKVDDYIDAVSSKSFAVNMSIQTALACHPRLGMYAVVREMGDLVIEDLEEQVRGIDVIELADIGMLFTRGRAGQKLDLSDETSETTAEDSEQTRSKSAK